MMKVALQITFPLFLILFLVTIIPAKSQKIVPQAELPIMVDFSEFNGANMSTAYPGWSEGDGDPPTPSIEESGWYSSEVLFDKAVAVSLNGNTHREWVITPSFQATENTKLTFDAAVSLLYNDPSQGFMDADDSIAIMVSTNGSDFYSVFAINQNNLPGLKMQQFDVYLGDFAGDEIRVGFYGTDGNIAAGQCAFHFDNVVIKNDPPQDAKAFELIAPQPDRCYSSNEPVIVSIKNDGQNTIYSVPVRVKLRGQVTQNLYNVYNGYIEPGDTAIFQVGTFDMSVPGDYEFIIQTELMNDGFILNNTKKFPIQHRPVFDKPLGPLDFTDYYTDNLSAIYPGWYEARGLNVPLKRMDTDWQANNNLGNRSANVFYLFTYTFDWIIGPKFEATEYTKLKFDAAIEYDEGLEMGSDDKLAIMVSSDCGETWQEIAALDQTSGLLPAFVTQTVDLSQFEGEEIIIAFYATTGLVSDYEKYYIHIDNVLIDNFYPSDVGVTALNQPSNPCAFSDDELIEVTVKNFGETAVSIFGVNYSVDEGAVVSETLSATIYPGSNYDYTFSQTADLSGAMEHNIKIWTSLGGDGNHGNDSLNVSVATSSFNLATEGAYSMGFEPNEDFSDWVVEDVNNDNHVWALNTEGQHAHNGVQSYWYSSNNSSVPSNDWLISPCFNLQAGATYRVSFYYKNRASLYPEKLRLKLGNSQSGNAMNQMLVDLGEIDNGSYLLSETEFSVATSGSYYFGWQAYGDADQFGCHIDDVEIAQIFDHDLAVEQVTIQRDYLPGTCEIEDADTVKVTVKNAGTLTETSIPVSISVNNGSPVSETFTETLLPGESIDLILSNGISIPASETVNVETWTSSPNDLNKANDTLMLTNFLLNDLYMDFEPYEDFSGWSQQSLTGGTTWELIEDADLSYSGDHCFGIRTDLSANNDYLYSSCMHLDGDACYTVSFYYRSRFSTEYMEVFLATDQLNTTIVDTVTVLSGFNSNAYLHEEVSFNVETSGDYYFVWHTQGGQSGRYWIYVDQIGVYENDLGPSAQIDFTVLDREVAFSSEIENVTNLLWDFGDGNTSDLQNHDHTYAENGTYDVTFIASNDCNQIVLQESLTIDCPVDANFTFSMPVYPNVVEFNTTSEAAGYLWDFDTGDYSFEQNPTYTFTNVGNYNVTLRTMNTCGVDSASQVIPVLTIGFEENTDLTGILIYPNPTDGRISVYSSLVEQAEISITDVNGKELQSGKLTKGNTSFNLTEFRNGIYFIDIKYGGKFYREKIIKH